MTSINGAKPIWQLSTVVREGTAWWVPYRRGYPQSELRFWKGIAL